MKGFWFMDNKSVVLEKNDRKDLMIHMNSFRDKKDT